MKAAPGIDKTQDKTRGEGCRVEGLLSGLLLMRRQRQGQGGEDDGGGDGWAGECVKISDILKAAQLALSYLQGSAL